MKRLQQFGEVATIFAVLGLIVIFGPFSQLAMIEQIVNSDTLLPAHMAWDVINHRAFADFQWPRVISLPDIAFFFAMETLGIGWRVAFPLYAWLAASLTALAIACVVSRMRAISFHRAAAVSGLAVAAVLLLSSLAAVVWPTDPLMWMPPLYPFIPVTHGNAFILSLFAARAAFDAEAGHRRMTWLGWGLCVLGTFSDPLFLAYFLAPLVGARLISSTGRVRGVQGLAAATWSVGITSLSWTLACVAGFLAQQLVFRQGFAGYELYPLWYNLGSLAADLRSVPWLAVNILLIVLFPAVAWWTRGKGTAAAAQLPGRQAWRWMVWFGTIAAALGLVVLVVFNLERDDPRYYYAYRYALPLLWWPAILVLGSLRARPAAVRTAAVGVAALSLVLIVPLRVPAIFGWRSLAERCVAANRADLGLRAGLAPYWQSRLAMASADWRAQIDQLDHEGAAYMWGNNVMAFQRDIQNPGQRPLYNFLIVDESLDAFDLSVRFGFGDQIVNCGKGTELWVYQSPVYPEGALDRPLHTFDLTGGWWSAGQGEE